MPQLLFQHRNLQTKIGNKDIEKRKWRTHCVLCYIPTATCNNNNNKKGGGWGGAWGVRRAPVTLTSVEYINQNTQKWFCYRQHKHYYSELPKFKVECFATGNTNTIIQSYQNCLVHKIKHPEVVLLPAKETLLFVATEIVFLSADQQITITMSPRN